MISSLASSEFQASLFTYSKGNKIKIVFFFLILVMESWPHVYWASAVH